MALSQAKGQKAIIQHQLKRTTFHKAATAPTNKIELLDEKEVGELTNVRGVKLRDEF